MLTYFEDDTLQDMLELAADLGDMFDYEQLEADYAITPRVYRVVQRGRAAEGCPIFRLGPLIGGDTTIREALFPRGRSATGGGWVDGGPGALRQFIQRCQLRNVSAPETHQG